MQDVGLDHGRAQIAAADTCRALCAQADRLQNTTKVRILSSRFFENKNTSSLRELRIRTVPCPEDGTIHEDDAAREDDTGPEDNDDDDVPSDAAPDTEADTEEHIQPQPNPLLLALGLDEVTPNRWGPNILAELASKWSETLKNGIRKEEKELMLKHT
ncbi:hypothetical protein MSG28_007188 [Choristoneura fumiferana]|uniref:Uncharacterized protein n=1 Tax=Choristoneura fumiferana TaxID=7141 RepID=A0ACC0JMY3_CHOFU|nr:hypothetical protein MSG28_007188 [Choristoneura fumiferana]